MIYSKIENPKCYICTNAKTNSASGNVTCRFKGTVPEDFCCRKFKYDIFKKSVKPHKKLKLNKFDKDNFII